ncbi:AraC family transcriptional regulator [Hymenobacter gummosus]|uniref:AraC family transcriptional regulator n=1 Tax=Hymenobacter gummosus TaxID=1776032 RepID=A0A3S0H4R2_9BACT|nr:AraC family transcriptional regulator [Hymenobacter gummosus]RTQ47813.1 AraC family transcriptional regulator [Hymenobacter gummosus]
MQEHVQSAPAPFELALEETAQWTQRPHRHNFFELVFVEEGQGQQCINYQQFAYGPGSVFLLPPLDCHSFQIELPTRFVFLRFTNQVFAPGSGGGLDFKAWFQKLSYILINYNRVPGDVVAARDKEHLWHCLQLIRQEHARPDAHSAPLIQTTLMTMLGLLTRHIEARLVAPAASPRSRRFLDVLNRIQLHLFDGPEALSVAALAAYAGMAPSYFGEYFRRHAGESLQAYITKSRLKVAEARLLHSDNSAKEIAFELGFTDTSHLSRTFRKYYGCTIQEFRQRGRPRLLSGSSACATAA